MHFDCRHCFPGLERIIKRLKHLLGTGPAWPLPHSWATTFLWGSLRMRTYQELAGPGNWVCAWLHTELQGWSSGQVLLNPRDLEEALGPSCTPGLAETPSHYHHLIQSCQIDDKVLPPGGHQQHSSPSPGQFPPPLIPSPPV